MAKGTGAGGRLQLLAFVGKAPVRPLSVPFKGFAVRLLLVCATLMELNACLAFVPGGDAAASDAAAPGGSARPDGSALPLGDSTLDLLICGVGPVAAALALGRYLGREAAMRRPEPLRGILNLGLAGAYDAGAAPVGSLVAATEEAYPEYGVWPHQEKGQPPLPLPLAFPQGEVAGQKVFTRLHLEPDKALGNMGLYWHSDPRRGPSVTVAGVSGTPRRAAHMAALGKGLTENMEGFSLALGAASAGIPFVELRAVSNLAGFRPPEGWDLPLALAALGQGTRELLAPLLFTGEAG